MARGREESMGPGALWATALSFGEMRMLLGWVALAAAWVAWVRPQLVVVLGGIVLGVVTWMFSEYFFHRFVLHMPRPRARFWRRVHSRIHYKHHQVPDDPKWLFVPWWGSPGLMALGALVGSLLGGAPWAASAFLGYGLALVHYELTHLAAHVSYRPRTRLGAWMKRHHLLHHFKNERYWFGVTHPLLDIGMRTWPQREDVEKSRTARTLGVDP